MTLNNYLRIPKATRTLRCICAISVLGGAMLAHCSSGFAQEKTRDGALLGGAAGAVIGGIIGNNKNDQTAEGALIGGAVGAVAGGIIGHQRDKAIEAEQAAIQAQQAQAVYGYPYTTYRTYPNARYGYPNRGGQVTRQPYYAGPGQPTIVYQAPVVNRYGVYRAPTRPAPVRVRQPVTFADVIHMTKHGVSDAVIVSHIQANGVATRPSVDDVIVLSQEGVSDYVITALQSEESVQVQTVPGNPMEMNGPVPRSGTLMTPPPLPSQRRGF